MPAPLGSSADLPRIISVDDHVLEPPDLWTSRLSSARFGDRIPHIERDRAKITFGQGAFNYVRGAEDGLWSDWWVFDDYQAPLMSFAAAVGFEGEDNTPTTFDEVDPGAWIQSHRLAAMDADHLEASLCFPNIFSRFCGQTFLEQKDRDLGLACVQAYNDWTLDDWTSGDGHGRLLPLTLIPLWDVESAVEEVRRCADKGTLAVAFSENPHHLGLPSIHSRYWDPFFDACAQNDLMLCMHIGSSSRLPTTSPDAPGIISSATHFSVSAGSLLDFIFSGVLDRFPRLKLFFAESQAGWMAFVLEQADWLYQRREGMEVGSSLPKKPSEYFHDRIFTSVYNDVVALRNRDAIGMSQICFETDYPHSVTSYPTSTAVASQLIEAAQLSPDDVYKFLRGNAIAGFGLQRVGIQN